MFNYWDFSKSSAFLTFGPVAKKKKCKCTFHQIVLSINAVGAILLLVALLANVAEMAV